MEVGGVNEKHATEDIKPIGRGPTKPSVAKIVTCAILKRKPGLRSSCQFRLEISLDDSAVGIPPPPVAENRVAGS